MAFFVNKQSMVLYCVVRKDEIVFFKSCNSDENGVESHILKCPSPPNQGISKGSNVSHMKEHHVIAAAVSNCGKFVTACDSNNLLHLWKYDTGSWNHQSQRQLIRKCQKVIFTNSGSEIIVADRGGDVFVFSVIDVMKEGKFLLGHISLIVDIAISSCDKYLLTCDRDGKIRISYYPNSYNIHSYCLGHEEFVSSVQNVQLSHELILTASGDGSVRIWNFCGDNVCLVNLFENEGLCKIVESCKIGADSKISLSCLLDEKQTTFAVKIVRLSPKNKICAISFYSVKGVAVYCISDSKDINFKFIQFIPTESIPFDILFNIDGCLIILQKNVDKQYSYFKYFEESEICFEEIDSNAISKFEEFEKLCGSIENLYEVQDNCEMLFKRNFDDKDDNFETKNNISKKSKIA